MSLCFHSVFQCFLMDTPSSLLKKVCLIQTSLKIAFEKYTDVFKNHLLLLFFYFVFLIHQHSRLRDYKGWSWTSDLSTFIFLFGSILWKYIFSTAMPLAQLICNFIWQRWILGSVQELFSPTTTPRRSAYLSLWSIIKWHQVEGEKEFLRNE